MALLAGIIFGLSLVGIISLFLIKWLEERRGAEFFPAWKRIADARALQFKDLLYALGEWAEHLPTHAWFIMRILLHAGALGFARLAAGASSQAHRIADRVSHRHRFERRETNSDFLKKVSAHKNGLNGSSNGSAGVEKEM